MSDSVRPHRWQPTRLPRPWDSPGKNTGVGCHFLLQCMEMKRESEVSQSCPTRSDSMDCSPPGSSIHGISQARVLEWVAIAETRNNLIMMLSWVSDVSPNLLMVCCWQMKHYLWSHCNSLFKHRHRNSSSFYSKLSCIYCSFTLKLSFKHFQGGIKFTSQ